jgi:hypothetical protein
MTQSPQPDSPPAPEVARAPLLVADSFDDMHDNQEELTRYSLLAAPLELCRKIGGEFDRADARAIKFQKAHRGLTHAAALSATVAVVTAVIALDYYPIGIDSPILAPRWLPSQHVMSMIEIWSAGIAIAVVLVGYFSHFKEQWLLSRHQAESYRLLRYRFLIHPSVWRQGEEVSREWIETRLQEIDRTTLAGAVREPAPHGPFEGTQIRLPRGILRGLTEYYLSRRLNPQKEYLANRTQRNEFSDWIRVYLPWFFFLSIVAVFCRVFVRSVRWEGFLALLAALLPAAAAGMRTWRGAFEFSRNKGRFEAAHQALRDLERRLVDEGFAAVEEQEQPAAGSAGAVAQDTDAYSILRDLSWCEHILESEHREWLRLMFETEWFG